MDELRTLTPEDRKKTICDACTDQARVEIHLKDSTKVLWLCSKHQRHLWSLAQAQIEEAIGR